VDDGLAGFREMLNASMEAAQRSPAEVIAADEAERMTDEEFDTALWLSLCGGVDRGAEPSDWPEEVRAYYTTRMVDWEVASGGFRQARAKFPEFFEPAAEGYELFGRPDLALLLRTASAEADLESLDALDVRLGQNDQERVAFARAHASTFRL
jgi:hypothetical protein